MKPCNVIDIKNVDISLIKKQKFGIDTNILYWMHYSKGALKSNYQTSMYPSFISDLIKSDNKLYTTVYNLSELLYIIERNEFQQYRSKKKLDITKKEYRDIVVERRLLKTEYESVLGQVKSIYNIHEFEINIVGVDDFTTNLNEHLCDNFDYHIINELKLQGINNYITDDSDFKSISDINLYTANPNVI